MKKVGRIGVFACLALLFAACGQAKLPETVDVTSLAVTDDGEVLSYLVDEFDKDYYSITDLTSMAMEEATEYNESHSDSSDTYPVTVNKVEMLSDSEGKVVLSHKFDSTETYARYNDQVLFYGTVGDAILAGYDLSGGVKNVKDGSVINEEQMMQDGGRKVLITDVKAVLYAPGRVAAISDGVYNENGTVDTAKAQGNVIILLK
ncbi:MAG: hypothetical protein IJ833_06820 [Lachnospiraceae bacterium]|nr:hypothetical protein [Lachnospiraceae bacterium]